VRVLWSRPSYSFFHHLGCATPRLSWFGCATLICRAIPSASHQTLLHVSPRLVYPMQFTHSIQPMQSLCSIQFAQPRLRLTPDHGASNTSAMTSLPLDPGRSSCLLSCVLRPRRREYPNDGGRYHRISKTNKGGKE
jgi:hypothetical protein